MACICSRCGETISKPYLVGGAIYGSTCVLSVLPKGARKPTVDKGEWVSAELITPLYDLRNHISNGGPDEIVPQIKAVFSYNGSKYSAWCNVNCEGSYSFIQRAAIVSNDQKQVMINLSKWKNK